MRILQVTETRHLFGGGEIYVSRLAELLVEAGHEVRWWAPGERGLSNLDELLALWNPAMGPRLRPLLEAFRPHLVHVHGVQHRLSHAFLGYLSRRGLPVVYTVHDFNLLCPKITLMREPGRLCESFYPSAACFGRCWREQPLKNLVRYPRLALQQRYLPRYVGAATAPSSRLTGFLNRRFGEGFCRHLPLFVPRGLEPAGPAGREPWHFLYAGRIHRNKGLHFLLDALARLRLRGLPARLTLLGEGPDRPELERQAQGLGLGEAVTFAGRTEPAGIGRWMGCCTALVLPSYWAENSPLTLYEALGKGIPVVAAEIGGIPDLVDHGATGLLFPPGDVAALAEALERIAGRSPWEAERMDEAIRRKAAELSGEAHRERLLGIYAEAIRRGHGEGAA